jgi:hypothetical protein
MEAEHSPVDQLLAAIGRSVGRPQPPFRTALGKGTGKSLALPGMM